MKITTIVEAATGRKQRITVYPVLERTDIQCRCGWQYRVMLGAGDQRMREAQLQFGKHKCIVIPE